MKGKSYTDAFGHRVQTAAHALLGDSWLGLRIRDVCVEHERQCRDIMTSRGVSHLTIAVVGAKGQGKTWLTRQFIFDATVRERLPSGILSRESTTQLHWIGPSPPDELDSQRELYHACNSDQMMDLGHPYMLLDTPGLTDLDAQAAEVARQALGLAPIKLLVTRRDQCRSAVNTQVAAAMEGAICLPVITAVPVAELEPSQGNGTSGFSSGLQSDIRQLLDLLRASAPTSQLLEPILVEDFETSGEELSAGKRAAQQIAGRLKGEPMEAIAETRDNRLAALQRKLRRNVSRLMHWNAPQLSEAVQKLHEEARQLPTQVVQSVLGTSVVLQTAVRGRLRAQIVTDTSSIWFPHKTILSVLGFTQGAWDRLLLALTGSVPSLFGTLATWARNVQTSRKISWEMQTGIRERMHRQIEDRLEPIHRQFYLAVHRLRTDHEDVPLPKDLPPVKLTGIDELQSRSQSLFDELVGRRATSSVVLQGIGFLSCGVFWGMLAGPVVSIYRQYFSASYQAISNQGAPLVDFPHATSSILVTSVLLSLIPVLLIAMVAMTVLLRRRKVEFIAKEIISEHYVLIDRLKEEGILQLHYGDQLLEHSDFLVHLDRNALL